MRHKLGFWVKRAFTIFIQALRHAPRLFSLPALNSLLYLSLFFFFSFLLSICSKKRPSALFLRHSRYSFIFICPLLLLYPSRVSSRSWPAFIYHTAPYIHGAKEAKGKKGGELSRRAGDREFHRCSCRTYRHTHSHFYRSIFSPFLLSSVFSISLTLFLTCPYFLVFFPRSRRRFRIQLKLSFLAHSPTPCFLPRFIPDLLLLLPASLAVSMSFQSFRGKRSETFSFLATFLQLSRAPRMKLVSLGVKRRAPLFFPSLSRRLSSLSRLDFVFSARRMPAKLTLTWTSGGYTIPSSFALPFCFTPFPDMQFHPLEPLPRRYITLIDFSWQFTLIHFFADTYQIFILLNSIYIKCNSVSSMK